MTQKLTGLPEGISMDDIRRHFECRSFLAQDSAHDKGIECGSLLRRQERWAEAGLRASSQRPLS